MIRCLCKPAVQLHNFPSLLAHYFPPPFTHPSLHLTYSSPPPTPPSTHPSPHPTYPLPSLPPEVLSQIVKLGAVTKKVTQA